MDGQRTLIGSALAAGAALGYMYAHLRSQQPLELLAQERQTLARERELLLTERQTLAREWEMLLSHQHAIHDELHSMRSSRRANLSPLPISETPHQIEPTSNVSTPGQLRRASSLGESPKWALVCLSYQTGQKELMCRVRHAIEAAGYSCIDGSRVPGGSDWRKVFFPALNNAVVYIPILSDSFLFSQACEDEITYAWDKRKKFLPIMFEQESFERVLRFPADYTDQREDICEVCPKLESMLNQRNRIPSTGSFLDDFDANIESVINLLKTMLPLERCYERPVPLNGQQPAAMLLQRLESSGTPEGELDGLRDTLATEIENLVQIVAVEPANADAIAALGELRYVTRNDECSTVATEQGLIEGCIALLGRLGELDADEAKLCAEQAAAVLQNLSGPADDKLGSGYEHFSGAWHEARTRLVDKLPELLPILEQGLSNGTEELQQHIANVINSCISLRVEGNSNTKKQAVALAKETATRRAALKTEILDAGIVAALCRCMQHGSERVSPAAQAANTLANMLYASPHVQQAILDENGLQLAAGLLRNTSSDLPFEKGAWVLKGLVYNTKQDEQTATVVQGIRDAGVLPLLKRCLENCTALHAVCQCADLLSNLLEQSGCDVAEEVVDCGIVEVVLPHLRDKMGKRSVNGMDGSHYEIGAAGSLARALYETARYPSCAQRMSHIGLVQALVEQLQHGPLIRPKKNSNQSFVEWISAILHALSLHEDCLQVVATALSLPEPANDEPFRRDHITQAIEALVQQAVEQRPEQVLLSWGISGKCASSHNKELGLPKRRGAAYNVNELQTV